MKREWTFKDVINMPSIAMTLGCFWYLLLNVIALIQLMEISIKQFIFWYCFSVQTVGVYTGSVCVREEHILNLNRNLKLSWLLALLDKPDIVYKDFAIDYSLYHSGLAIDIATKFNRSGKSTKPILVQMNLYIFLWNNLNI